MKATLLLATLAVGLIAATQSFAQGTNFGPAYSYSTGHESGTPGPNRAGQSEHQDRAEHR
jgi:hypothetical protein